MELAILIVVVLGGLLLFNFANERRAERKAEHTANAIQAHLEDQEDVMQRRVDEREQKLEARVERREVVMNDQMAQVTKQLNDIATALNGKMERLIDEVRAGALLEGANQERQSGLDRASTDAARRGTTGESG